MFTVTDEQRLVVDTARRYLTDHGRTDSWEQGLELGWTSLLSDPDEPHRFTALVLLAREFGRAVAPGPLGPANVAAYALAQVDGVPGLASTAWVPGAEVRRTDDGYVLAGEVRPVEAAADARWLLVTSRSDAVLVEADHPGVTITPLQSLDLYRSDAAVRFDDVTLPARAGVDDVDPAELLDLAVLVQLGELLGTMEWGFATTLQWTFDRYSFGRPLASYQAIQHRVADLAMWLEASRAVVGDAARAFDAGSADRTELVSAAKSYVGRVGPELLQECVQLHGGIGVTAELDLHLYLRRAAALAATHGTPREHAVRVGELVESR